MTTEDIPSLGWDDFTREFTWRQGEHVAVIAPTGAGKTTVVQAILPIRKYVIFFGTKKEDKIYSELQRSGYRRVESVSEIGPLDTRLLLWPRHRKTIAETVAIQRYRFREAFDWVARWGRWTVVYDECKYLTEVCKLGTELTFMQEQMRSMKGTNVSGAQRPFWLPRAVLGSATHAFLWKTTDADDLKRLSDMGGINRTQIKNGMGSLGKHEFIYICTRGTDARMVRSQVRK